MHDLTEEQIAKMKAAGYTPVESIKKRVVLRPKLYVLHGFKNESQFNTIVNILTQEVRTHYEETREEWKIGIETNQSVGTFLTVPKPLLTKLKQEDISSLTVARTSYPTPIIPYSPRIFRYMDKEFVDAFFEKGKLRLSSFKSFAKHENPNMKDQDEGKIALVVKAGEYTVTTKVGLGDNSFVLCCSVLDDNLIEKQFDYNAGFCVENLEGFIQTINLELKKRYALEIYDVLHGSCIYLPDRNLEGESQAFEIDALQNSFGIYNNPPSVNFDVMSQRVSEYVKDHGLFLKENKYAHEHEYRILWNIEADTVPEYIDIVVPDAVKFCKRIR